VILKKPYAFFIKYFRLINFIVVLLFSYLASKLYYISDAFSKVYNNESINYATLNSKYIGFKSFLVLFSLGLFLSIIILLLKTKKKPLKDYLYATLYIVLIFIYLIYISNIFYSLGETIIEQTTLKLYSDISFLIVIPSVYFIVKLFLIVIGFNLKKFDFTNDIIELKQDEKDNEEIEIIFDKNVYKYKRKLNKTIRELKYYYLENKILILVITCVVTIILFVSLFNFDIFNSNNVNLNETFVANNISYKVTNAYITEYNTNNKIIKKENKFIIVNVSLTNVSNVSQSIDFKNIRLLYGKNNYVYANNYYNKHFYDLGIPYNGELLLSRENKNYLFVFNIPSNVSNNEFVLKFYDKVVANEEGLDSIYKEININPKNIDKKTDEVLVDLNNVGLFDKDKYKNSKLTFSNYEIKSNYIYNDDNLVNVLKDEDINKQLLIVDYKLEIDSNTSLSNYINNHKEFFNNLVLIEYNYNGRITTIKSKVIDNVDGKILLSVPYELSDSENINLVLSFRNKKIKYKLK